jgi:hypothetical protein
MSMGQGGRCDRTIQFPARLGKNQEGEFLCDDDPRSPPPLSHRDLRHRHMSVSSDQTDSYLDSVSSGWTEIAKVPSPSLFAVNVHGETYHVDLPSHHC